MTHILMLGEDASLLAVRALVLAKAGAKITTCLSWQFNAASWNDTFDLAIFCHTVSGSLALQLVQEVVERWPGIQVVALESALGRTPLPRGLLPILSVQPPNLLRHVKQLQQAAALRSPGTHSPTPLV